MPQPPVSAASVPSPDAILVSARRLAAGLGFSDDEEHRLLVLKRVARQLADHGDGYPVFLKLLLTIAESDDARAKQALAATLATALRRADLPSGPLTSWGASSLWNSGTEVRAGTLINRLSSAAPRRQFGPIEYLTTWHCQRTHRDRLSDASYADGLHKLIELVNHNAEARRLYPRKLAVDAQNEFEGSYTRLARERLASIADAWTENADPSAVVAAAVPESSAAAAPVGWYLRNL